MNKVFVSCKLPHGIILEHPTDASKKVTISGRNKALVIGSDYATTEVDEDFWKSWALANKDFPALKSGAIFFAKTQVDAKAIATEFKSRKVGFEAMSQTAGVKPASVDML